MKFFLWLLLTGLLTFINVAVAGLHFPTAPLLAAVGALYFTFVLTGGK